MHLFYRCQSDKFDVALWLLYTGMKLSIKKPPYLIISESEMLCKKHIKNTEQKTDNDSDDDKDDVSVISLREEIEILKKENELLKQEITIIRAEKKKSTILSAAKNDVDNVKEELFTFSTELIKNLKSQLDTKMNEIIATIGQNKIDDSDEKKLQIHQNTQKTYSNAVTTKKKVIIQPSSEQEHKTTFQFLREKISLTHDKIAITKVQRLKKGGVVIECENEEEAQKLQNKAVESSGDKYTVRKVKYLNPKIKIVGLSENMGEEELKTRIMQQNQGLKDKCSLFKLITVKKW